MSRFTLNPTIYTPSSTLSTHRLPHPSRLFRKLQQPLQIDTLRPFNRQSKGSIPDQLRQGAETARDAEGGGVVERVVEAVVVEEHAGGGIDVWVGVFGLWKGDVSGALGRG